MKSLFLALGSAFHLRCAVRATHGRTNPIKLIAPYPPGGQTDIVSRWLGEKLTPVLGQPVLVENRAGAQGASACEAAKNAAPDGYTFVYTNVSNHLHRARPARALPYDAQKDFAPVTQLGLSVLAMVVPASLGPKTLKEFVAWAKANPGKVSFASFGNGSTSHVYGEMLKGAAGLRHGARALQGRRSGGAGHARPARRRWRSRTSPRSGRTSPRAG